MISLLSVLVIPLLLKVFSMSANGIQESDPDGMVEERTRTSWHLEGHERSQPIC